ncbi:MAG TPA: ribonuclease H-like domain-containing protein [Candidatus Dormibacteraeota bacterium]|nr:ribonuclease H-like domain-containing protein [Candidatus Dormibacteraeota bacterium]
MPPRRALAADRGPGLEAALEKLGFVAEDHPAGTAWVRRAAVDLGPFLAAAAAPAPVSTDGLLRLAAGGAHDPPSGVEPRAITVLDIETLGLRGSGVVAFLVGLGVPRGDELEVQQLLLADLDAETALLQALLRRLDTTRLLATYNGRTFDVPVLRARCIVNRVDPAPFEQPVHCDLLAPVRRLFRDRMGACTLRQAEQLLLALHREDDCPGSEAPDRYRTWLRGGDAAVVEGVVRHNELDLAATMVLAARLAAHVEGALVEPVHPADRYRLGIHLERAGGVAEDVDSHYRAALHRGAGPWDRHAGLRLARRRARRGGEEGLREARAVLVPLWRRDPADLQAGRVLAITLERLHDLEAAARVCEEALAACAGLGRWRLERMRGAPPEGWVASWERRLARLGRRRSRLERRPVRRRAQIPPPVGVGEGAAAAGLGEAELPFVFANWSNGICQSPSPSSAPATREVFLTTTMSPR